MNKRITFVLMGLSFIALSYVFANAAVAATSEGLEFWFVLSSVFSYGGGMVCLLSSVVMGRI